MQETKKIQLSENLKKGYSKGILKAKDVIQFLLNNGFTSTKETNLSALSDLSFEGKNIEKVKLNSEFIFIHFKK